MLMAVKRQVKVTLLSIKYAFMRELLNKTTFFSNVFFIISYLLSINILSGYLFSY